MKHNDKMNKKCPWCGSENAKLHLKVKDEFLTKESFEILSCEKCGLLFTQPRPDKEHISAYYKSENYYSHQENKKGFIPRIYEKVKSINLKNKYAMATQGMKAGEVLDIGCGVGDFLHIMETKGWKATGIEPSEEAKVIAKTRMKAELLGPDEIENLPNQSFDLITMWHVLEHVDDLQFEVKQLQRILKKNGRLVIAVPNFKSYDGQFYKEFWAAYDVPRHLNHFSKEFISNLFINSDLILTKTTKLKWDAYYISWLSEQYKKHSLSLFRGAYRGLVSNCKAKKSGEWSSMVYLFEKQ